MQRCETTGDAGEHPVKAGAAGLPGEVCLDAGNGNRFREYWLYSLEVLKL